MHAEMRSRPSTVRPWLDRIGVRALVSAAVVVVLLASALELWDRSVHIAGRVCGPCFRRRAGGSSRCDGRV